MTVYVVIAALGGFAGGIAYTLWYTGPFTRLLERKKREQVDYSVAARDTARWEQLAIERQECQDAMMEQFKQELGK